MPLIPTNTQDNTIDIPRFARHLIEAIVEHARPDSVCLPGHLTSMMVKLHRGPLPNTRFIEPQSWLVAARQPSGHDNSTKVCYDNASFFNARGKFVINASGKVGSGPARIGPASADKVHTKAQVMPHHRLGKPPAERPLPA